MRLITLPQRGGKTEALLAWMQESPDRVFVSTFAGESERVRRLARERKLDIADWRFVTLGEVQHGARLAGRGPLVLGLDNVDDMLFVLLGHPVRAVSLTVGDDRG